MDNELYIGGIGINKEVVATIVSQAASKVEGVASVGGNDITSSLISVITSRSVSPERAVECSVDGDKLNVSVRLAVFYGYPFTKLADDVRSAISNAVTSQIGTELSAVDVMIDSLVFPKE